MEAAPHPWPALGILLMRDGLVSKEALEEILDQQFDARQQRVSSLRLGEILVQRGTVAPEQVARLVAEQYELPFIDFDASEIDVEAARVLSEDDARRFSAVVLSRSDDGEHLVAIADPSTVLFSDELRRMLGSSPRFAVVGPGALEKALEAVYGGRSSSSQSAPSHLEPFDDDPGREAILLRFSASSGSAFELLESRLAEAAETRTQPLLGALLVRDGFVTESELDTALAQQRISPSLRLGEILVDKGIVTPIVVARLVAEQYELPFVELETRGVDPAVAARLPDDVAHRLGAVPVAELEDGSLEVAVADPTIAVESDELRQILDVALSFVVAAPDAIEALLDRIHAPISEPVPIEAEEVDAAVDVPDPGFEDDSGELDADDVMPSVAFVLDAFAQPWEDEPPFIEEGAETVDFDEIDALDSEPEPPLLFEPRTSTVLDEPAEAEVVELPVSARPSLELVPDLFVEAKVVELASTTPLEPEHDADEAAQPTTNPESTAKDDVVRFDIFGIGSLNATETIVVDDSVVEEVETDEPPVHEVEGESDETPDLVSHTSEVEELVTGALAAGASAIHLSPHGDHLVVRARVDGIVRDLGTASPAERDGLVARLEANGVAHSHVVFTSRGPKTTLLVHDRADSPSTLDALGLDASGLVAVRNAVTRPAGAVLVCGPAASGVTTTFSALLGEVAAPGRIVASIESSVERPIDGVDQIEIDPASGATSASALRELSSADTDVVFVSELDTRETAELALRLAYDGRLVVAGLRAPDSVEALRRLSDMGVERAVLAGSVTCVVAQRLLRTVCPDCHEPYYATPEDLASLDQPEGGSPRLLVRGAGCSSCGGTGLRGRVGVLEVLPMTDEIRELLVDGASRKKLRKAARAAGMRTLRDEAALLCLDGITSVAEVSRVLGTSS